MMRALILAFWLVPTVLSADAFDIRSGEHDGFSRLVIYLDAPRDWGITATEAGYELTVADSPEGFDTSEVFEFIPKRRLTDISSSPDRLTLDVSCDCPVQAFAYRPDILVLDIYSERPDEAGFPNAEIVVPYAARTENVAQTDEVVDEPSEDTVAQVKPETISAEPLPSWEDRLDKPRRASAVLGFVPPAAYTDQRVDRSEIVAGIAQAASHGLVTLSDPEARASAAEFPAIPGLRSPASHINVRDSLVRGGPPGALPVVSPNTCLPADLFAVHEWGDPDVPASVLLSEMRVQGASSSVGPSGADDALGIIRSYLYLGFGSEAIELVRTYRMSRREERAYFALAEIVDAPGAADRNPLADQLHCDSAAALWSFVATTSQPANGDPIDAENILRNFQRLPSWLRLQIGETAAANFEIRGDSVSAETVRASVARVRAAQAQQSEDEVAAQQMADAALKGEDEHHALSDRAHRMRAAQDVLRSDGAVGGLTIEDRTEIKALILETRGSEESVALLESYVQFAAAPEDILAAEHLLTVLSRSRFANRYPLRMGWDAILAASTAQPSHDVFLGVLARNRRTFSRTTPNRATADAAIARLRAIGLPQSAEDYAKTLGASTNTPVVQLNESAGLEASLDAPGPGDQATPVSLTEGSVNRAGGPDRDAAALRSLLKAGTPAPDEPGDATSVQNAPVSETPLEALRAAESAIEVLDRVLGPGSSSGG